jgi:hypothetical protein
MFSKKCTDYLEITLFRDEPLFFISRPDLIRAKEASGRPQDKIDVEKLKEAEQLDSLDKK